MEDNDKEHLELEKKITKSQEIHQISVKIKKHNLHSIKTISHIRTVQPGRKQVNKAEVFDVRKLKTQANQRYV